MQTYDFDAFSSNFLQSYFMDFNVEMNKKKVWKIEKLWNTICKFFFLKIDKLFILTKKIWA